ncbi:MAG: efflux transporter periplasmic adaptor subunit, partial [Lentisphaeraceae bacterium]|nr:efflux transporter periplasmic adaptor subunit [Lentisphaeraceae bacterium]
MKKTIILIALVLFAGCAEKRKRPQMPVALVKVAPVIEQNVASVQDYVGRVYADRTVALKARVEGILEKQL